MLTRHHTDKFHLPDPVSYHNRFSVLLYAAKNYGFLEGENMVANLLESMYKLVKLQVLYDYVLEVLQMVSTPSIEVCVSLGKLTSQGWGARSPWTHTLPPQPFAVGHHQHVQSFCLSLRYVFVSLPVALLNVQSCCLQAAATSSVAGRCTLAAHPLSTDSDIGAALHFPHSMNAATCNGPIHSQSG